MVELVEQVTDIHLIYNVKDKGFNNNLVSQINYENQIIVIALKLNDEYAFCESRYLYEYDITLAVKHKQFKLIFEYHKLNKYYMI